MASSSHNFTMFDRAHALEEGTVAPASLDIPHAPRLRLKRERHAVQTGMPSPHARATAGVIGLRAPSGCRVAQSSRVPSA